MSTRDDASLTARERAALASLEATAAAEDPQLASRLRGSQRLRWITARLPEIPAWARSSTWGINALLAWGIPAALVGLALMVLSLSVGLMLGVAGALLATCGLMFVAGVVDRCWISGRSPS